MLTAEYHRVLCDPNFADRWHLREPLSAEGAPIDARSFTRALSYRGPAPARIPIRQAGRRVAFNLAAFDMPVVTHEIADLIERAAPQDVERFPVVVDDAIHGYEILNVTRSIACLDETRSDVAWWTEKHDRPDKIGQYSMVLNMKIDPTRASQAEIFRIGGWKIALIVSDRIMRLLAPLPELGVRFDPVV